MSTRRAPVRSTALQQVVDPLVDVQVDRRAVHARSTPVLFEAPPKPFGIRSSWVGCS